MLKGLIGFVFGVVATVALGFGAIFWFADEKKTDATVLSALKNSSK